MPGMELTGNATRGVWGPMGRGFPGNSILDHIDAKNIQDYVLRYQLNHSFAGFPFPVLRGYSREFMGFSVFRGFTKMTLVRVSTRGFKKISLIVRMIFVVASCIL